MKQMSNGVCECVCVSGVCQSMANDMQTNSRIYMSLCFYWCFFLFNVVVVVMAAIVSNDATKIDGK